MTLARCLSVLQLEDRDSGTESDEENAELQALVEGECHRNIIPCIFTLLCLWWFCYIKSLVVFTACLLNKNNNFYGNPHNVELLLSS